MQDWKTELEQRRETYKTEHNLQKFTGVYTIEEIEVLPKTIKLKCNDGYTYTHSSVKKLVNR